MERQKAIDGRPKVSDDPLLIKPRLPDLGVSPQQARDWSRMAAVPDEVYAAHVEDVVVVKRPLTTAGVVRLARAEQDRRDRRLPVPGTCALPMARLPDVP
jgi:hypothetical protein